MNAGEPVSTERLIDGLWGERVPETAPTMVHMYVSRLRRALNGNGQQVLTSDPRGYVLHAQPDELDVVDFERLAAAGREAFARGDAQEAAARLHEALALFRGAPLADVREEPFAGIEARRLEELRAVALEDRIEADLALGRHDELVPELQTLVEQHPYRERLRGHLMLALYRSGRQADALDAYQDARRVLVDELGVEPSEELRTLHRAILEQDKSLARPARPTPEAPQPRRRRALALALVPAAVAAVATVIAVVVVRGGEEPSLLLRPNSIGRIDPKTNRVVEAIRVGTKPAALALGHGSLWVANSGDQAVERIDPKQLEIVRTFPTGGHPTALAVDEDGVWVRNDPEDTLVEIDPEFGTVSEPVAVPGGRHAALYGVGSPQLAAGDGAIWTVSAPTAVVRIDAAGRTPGSSVEPDAGATGALAYADGALWIGGQLGVTKYRPGRAPSPPVALRGEGPTAIVAEATAVWVAYRSNIAVIRPAAQNVIETVELTSRVRALAVSRDAVWAALPSERVVVKIDREAREEVARIPLGASPTALAARGDRVWVAVE